MYHKEERRTCNIVKDFHYKLAWYLCSNFENICWPNFKASEIMMLDLNCGVKRRCNILSFYKLMSRINEISKIVKGGCVIHRGSEAYSSKMCSWCSRLKENLGGGRVFRCSYDDCYFSSVDIPRDGGAAVNIEMFTYLHGVFPLSHEVWKNINNLKLVKVGSTLSRTGELIEPPDGGINQ